MADNFLDIIKMIQSGNRPMLQQGGQPTQAPQQTNPTQPDPIAQLEDVKKSEEQKADWIKRAVKLGIPLGAAIAGSVSPGMLPEMAGLGGGFVKGVQRSEDIGREQAEKREVLDVQRGELERKRQKDEKTRAVLSGKGEGSVFRPESVSDDGVTYKRQKSTEEIAQDVINKAKGEAVVVAEKQRQTNIGKVKRLRTIANTLKDRFLETSPGSGIVGRISGISSVPASFFQANEQQQIDSSYRTFVKGMRAQLARAMGDVGNLSEPEQKAAMDLVPKLSDTKEVGLRKLKMLEDFVVAIESGNSNLARELLGSYNEETVVSNNDPLGIR